MTREEFEKLELKNKQINFWQNLWAIFFNCIGIALMSAFMFLLGALTLWVFITEPSYDFHPLNMVIKHIISLPNHEDVFIGAFPMKASMVKIKMAMMVVIGFPWICFAVAYLPGKMIDRYFNKLKEKNNCSDDILFEYKNYFIGDTYTFKDKSLHSQKQEQLIIIEVDYKECKVKMDNGEIIGFDELEQNYTLVNKN